MNDHRQGQRAPRRGEWRRGDWPIAPTNNAEARELEARIAENVARLLEL